MRAPTGMTGIEVVEQLIAAWNRRDLDGFVGLLTDDVE
jgi:hypothetical protein